MGSEPATAEPGRTQNPGEAVTADNKVDGTLAEPHISRALKTFSRPYRNQFKETSCRTTGEQRCSAATQKSQPNQIISISDWKSGTVTLSGPEFTKEN